MESSRAKIAEQAIKNAESFRKTIKKTTSNKPATPDIIKGPTPILPSGLPTPIAGSGFLQVIMYIIAGILVIGIVLLTIDQLVTPIFQSDPGSAGYIFMPGSDTSVVFWKKTPEIQNIIVGSLPSNTSSDTLSVKPLSTSIIEGQSSYSITLDVLIKDEFPQNLGTQATDNSTVYRTFFALGPPIAGGSSLSGTYANTTPTLVFELDNYKNTVYITSYDSNRLVQTAIIDNVPIHKPFRLGVVKTPNLLEGYLNGMLVRTIKLRSNTIDPNTGDTIYSADNINKGEVLLSKGIKTMNLRLFGEAITPAEMKARMTDLAVAGKSQYNDLMGVVYF
jgi:hypothetical protein